MILERAVSFAHVECGASCFKPVFHKKVLASSCAESSTVGGMVVKVDFEVVAS